MKTAHEYAEFTTMHVFEKRERHQAPESHRLGKKGVRRLAKMLGRKMTLIKFIKDINVDMEEFETTYSEQFGFIVDDVRHYQQKPFVHPYTAYLESFYK